jgi:hypothetical protein
MGHGSIISSLGTAPGNLPAERGFLVCLAALMRRRHKESTNGGFAPGYFHCIRRNGSKIQYGCLKGAWAHRIASFLWLSVANPTNSTQDYTVTLTQDSGAASPVADP